VVESRRPGPRRPAPPPTPMRWACCSAARWPGSTLHCARSTRKSKC
jgi:hypothetical protein